MSDFHKMSSMMKNLFPSTPEQDRAALRAMAQAPAQEAAPTVDYINETAQVKQGSLPLDIDSVSDFAALAGVKVNEKQKDGDYARGSDPMPAMSVPTTSGETTHPLKDKLVGEDEEDRITALERRIEALEAMLSERELTKGEENKKEKYVKGMKKNKGDFEKRYGDDAKAVMYATATKMAKKII